jgi:hypothetical protein
MVFIFYFFIIIIILMKLGAKLKYNKVDQAKWPQ